MGALILPSRFNQQPQQGTLTSKALHVLFNPAAAGQQGNVALTTGAAWQRVATPFGVGLQGGYVVSPVGPFPTSADAGDKQFACRTEHITFVILSNAAVEGLMSWGVSATDSGPQILLQNNAGTLRAFDGLGGYTNLAPAVIGRRYVYSRVYNDFAPYTTSHYLNGVPIFSYVHYQNQGSVRLWIGIGYPAQSTNAAILLYAGRSGVAETPSEVAAYAANPWQVFAAPRRLWAVASGGTTFSYTASGGFTLSGTATTVRSATKTTTGGLQLSGSAATARGAVRSASGGFQLSGSAAQARSKAFTASGGISFSGAASVLKGVARLATGGLSLSGAASAIFTATTQSRIVTAAGGFALSGTAAVIRVCTRATSGGINFAGAAATSFQRAGAVIGGWINMARRRRRE